MPDPSLVIDYNRFLYVRANPLKYNDPSGHCPVCIIIIAGLAATMMDGSVASMPAGSYTRSPGANLPPYRQGAKEVRHNRATIESLASDQVPGILLAASIANQGNTYQRPLGWDGGEFVQIFVDPDPSVGIGQIRPGEARGLGYEGSTIGLLHDEISIQLMATKLEATAASLGEFNLDPTESFVLSSIGNNIGRTVAQRYGNLPKSNRSVQSLLESYPDARTQLLKMMNWMEYLHANHDWSFPEDVDTDRVWQMLQDSYSQ